MNEVRIGVVGTGWWGTQVHLPAAAQTPGARIAAVADAHAPNRAAAAERFGVPHAFGTAEELIGSGLVDAVVVATPHVTHFEIVRSALVRGLHVLVEKPMVLRAAEARELEQLAAAGSVKVVVGFTHNFTRDSAWVREQVHSGCIGDLVHVTATYSGELESFFRGDTSQFQDLIGAVGPRPTTYSDPALSGGGHLQAQGSHALGCVLGALSDDVAEVAAFMNRNGSEVDMTAALALRFAGGATGTLTTVGVVRPGQPATTGITFYGTRGAVHEHLDGSASELVTADGQRELGPGDDNPYPMHAPMQALVRLLREGGTLPEADASLGRRAVEVTEAAYRSARSSRVVTVAELYEAVRDERDYAPWLEPPVRV